MSRKGAKKTGLRDLLRRRGELDRKLASFKRELGVLFADISGSTSFYERRGDVSGIAMVQQFLDQARAAVTPVGGWIVKSLGDGVLVRFAEPSQAVQGALALRDKVKDYNATRAEADHLQVRIGLTWGSGFVKEGDVFGDVVNLAARLEQLAKPGQILLSGGLRSAVQGIPGAQVRRLAIRELKGRAAPQEVYELELGASDKATQGYALVLVGTEVGSGREFKLESPTTLLGRNKGGILFPADRMLSSRHARFVIDRDGLRVEPLGRSGVFLRVAKPTLVDDGDLILVGKKVLEFRGPVGKAQPCLRLGRRSFPLEEEEAVIGRREGAIVFADDAYLSGRHARIFRTEEGYQLEDLGSTNGTFRKVRRAARLAEGDELLCGSQHLRVRRL